MEVTFKPCVALTLGAFAISIAAARFPCLRVHALDKDGDFGDMVGDAEGFRDDAKFDLYKKFVKIVISVNKLIRGRAEQESRISIPVPAVPVSELLAGKKRKICKSLN